MHFFHCFEERSAPSEPLSLVERLIRISVFACGSSRGGHSKKDIFLAGLKLKVSREEAGHKADEQQFQNKESSTSRYECPL